MINNKTITVASIALLIFALGAARVPQGTFTSHLIPSVLMIPIGLLISFLIKSIEEFNPRTELFLIGAIDLVMALFMGLAVAILDLPLLAPWPVILWTLSGLFLGSFGFYFRNQ